MTDDEKQVLKRIYHALVVNLGKATSATDSLGRIAKRDVGDYAPGDGDALLKAAEQINDAQASICEVLERVLK